MQVVIDIDEYDYEKVKELVSEGVFDYEGITPHLFKGVANGTPLPKGHSDLIERDATEYLKAIHDAKYGHISWSDAIKKIKHSAPTIIKADKETDDYYRGAQEEY